MEQTEVTFLREHLPKLLQNVKCNNTLLAHFAAKHLLSQEDMENIKAKGTDTAQTREFFEIILTRHGAFNILVEALQESMQSGALDVLKTYKKTSKTNGNLPAVYNFCTPPKYLKDFMDKKTNGNKNTFVVYSENPVMTCERILSTVSDCVYFSKERFLNFISNPLTNLAENGSKINVVNCEGSVLFLQQAVCNIHSMFILVDKQGSDEPINSTLSAREKIQWSELSAKCRQSILDQIKKLTNLSEGDCLLIGSDLSHKTLLEFISGVSPNIFLKTIPVCPNYYIPRQLVCRCKINSDIFNTVAEDVFLIEGIELYQLSALVSDKCVDTSRNIIKKGLPFQTKFIVLENPDHIQRILKLVVNLPVHHLFWKDNDLIWKFSHGTIKYIHRNILGQEMKLQEDTLIDNADAFNKNKRFVCISDAAGMGKSVLLAHIASSLEKKTEHGLVSFLTLTRFVQEVKKVFKSSGSKEPTEYIFQALTNLVSNTNLGIKILETNKSYLKHLFLDAFDEVNRNDLNLAYKCLRRLPIIFPKTKFWISTRPHLLLELEKHLEVLGYNIKPFDNDDQINFLTSFWNQKIFLNKHRLHEYARKCLESIASNLNGKEELAGIPLQCLLIGEVYSREAEQYCNSESISISSVPIFKTSSIVNLYKELVRQKFDKFFSVYSFPKLDQRQLQEVHIYHSVALLFPAFAKKILHMNHQLDVSTICCAGIMELKPALYHPEPQFIHRTFAEYFVANYVYEKLTSKQTIISNLVSRLISGMVSSKNEFILKVANLLRLLQSRNLSLLEFIYRNVLETQYVLFEVRGILFEANEFTHNVICSFLNSMLENPDVSINECFLKTPDTLYVDKFRCLLSSCLYTNFENIYFKLIGKSFVRSIKSNSVFSDELVIIATVRSNTNIAGLVYKKFKTHSTLVGVMFKNNYSLLQLAVISGNYSKVEYLVKNGSLLNLLKEEKFKDLIRECLIKTRSENLTVIDEKIQILRFIFERKRTLARNLLLEDAADHPIYGESIHVKLALVILASASNHILIKFLHKNVTTYNCNEYLNLLACLTQHSQFKLSTIICHAVDKLPLWYSLLVNSNLNKDFLEFIKENHISVTSLHWTGLSFLELAIKHEQTLVIDWLLNNSDQSYCNHKLLNFVLSLKNFRCLAYLLNRKLLSFCGTEEWSELTWKVCNAIHGVTTNGNNARISKYIISILEIAISNGAILTVVEDDSKKSSKPTLVQLVENAKPFLFEVSTFLIEKSSHP